MSCGSRRRLLRRTRKPRPSARDHRRSSRASGRVLRDGRAWRFTYVNERAENLLQRTREELVGREHLGRVSRGGRSHLRHGVQSRDGVPCRGAVRGVFPPLDGWFEVSAFPSGHRRGGGLFPGRDRPAARRDPVRHPGRDDAAARVVHHRRRVSRLLQQPLVRVHGHAAARAERRDGTGRTSSTPTTTTARSTRGSAR